jgi:DeoR/GlpR family transcriptional regulator of sugar metabolism
MNNFEKIELGKKIIDLITRKKSVTTQDILDRFPEPEEDIKETLIYLQKEKKIYAIEKPVKSPNKIRWGRKE